MIPGALIRTDPEEGADVCVGRAEVGGAVVAGVCDSAEVEDVPSSRMEGSSGGGPSRAQRRDSYFDRIYDSILLKMDVYSIEQMNHERYGETKLLTR